MPLVAFALSAAVLGLIAGILIVAVYDIRVAGQIDGQWSAWLGGLTVTHPRTGEAMISGEIVDEAALHGTLN